MTNVSLVYSVLHILCMYTHLHTHHRRCDGYKHFAYGQIKSMTEEINDSLNLSI